MVDIDRKLQSYLKIWELSQPRLLAVTPTSSIYEVSKGEDLILKIFTPSGAIDEKSSSEVLKIWNGDGAAHLHAFDEGALLIERLYDPHLDSFSAKNEEDQATEIFIQIIQKIHVHPIPRNHTIPELATLFKPLDTFTQFPASRKNLFQKAVEISHSLLATQQNVVVLHGDLHHENVMMRKTGEYVCFDPKGFIGDPCYEIATILKNPWSVPQISENEDLCLARAERLAKVLELPLQRILDFAFVHMCLSTMWAFQDGQDPTHQLRIASFLEKHVS